MRIAYFVPAALLRHEGIRRRAAATAGAWRELGHDVTEVVATRPEPAGAGLAALVRWQHACDRDALAELQSLVTAHALDQVHLRLFVPAFGWSDLARRVPVTLEVHALAGLPESARDLYRVAAGWLPTRRLAGRATAAVFVTEDMADRFGHPGLPRVAIGNGVPLTEPLPAPANDRPRLVLAVGSRGAWHGLDRLDALARAVPEASWGVVTPEPLARWAAQQLGAGSPVEILATSNRREYDDALAASDATVGTLALDRRRLREAAPLKVRDSVAAGIPVLLPYRDTNLHRADDPAVLRVDPTSPAATAAAVRRWLPQLAGRRVYEPTRSLVDIRSVEAARIGFLAKITAGRGPDAGPGAR